MYLELARGMAKTTCAAIAAIEWAMFQNRSEIVFFAGDVEQARIALTIMQGMIRDNPVLANNFEVMRDRIETPLTSTVCRVMSSDAITAFGIGGQAQSLLVVVDEFWVWTNPLLWEAVISSTGKVGSNWRVLILSNAGIHEDSKIAWRVREEARSGEDPAMYFWSSDGCIAGWVDEGWKQLQKRLLTPGGYTRLIDNVWTTSESSFIEDADWAALEDPHISPYPTDTGQPVIVGIDASKSARKGADTTAVVAVRREGGFLRLVAHQVWEPTGRGGDVDLRGTVLEWLKRLNGRYRTVHCLYDPYNLSTLAQIGRESGLTLVECPQTTANQTRFTASLLDSIRAMSLKVYNAPDLRDHVLNVSLVETPRGNRLAKEKGSKKIDAAVALAMAVDGAHLMDVPGQGVWLSHQ
jgi:phage terminase large subunit-like protein